MTNDYDDIDSELHHRHYLWASELMKFPRKTSLIVDMYYTLLQFTHNTRVHRPSLVQYWSEGTGNRDGAHRPRAQGSHFVA
jgi:hypothetical protein